MKRYVAFALILSAALVAASAEPIQLSGKPADGPMGLGIFLGQPTGVTFELDLAEASWLDFKAAWDFGADKGGYSVMLQGNYELAFPGMIAIEEATFTPFVGGGVLLNLYDGGANFGVRVPGGVSYRFSSVPFELFLEAGLDIYLFPGFDLGASGGLGARYRF